ncbi:MAG: competence/damage-inducible protein A [Bacteroidetes bacterium]|nr:competence/damage-inducible protein A [Bacteroidota bacterium]
MKVYIITIGDEILIGQTLNTNAAFIGNILTQNQFEVPKTSVVGDNEAEILEEFKYAFEKYDVVIVTGGLGPTHDDVTRNCVVKFFNTELVNNNDVLTDIKEIFSRSGRKLTPTNEDQANVPKIAEVIRNSRGTAPGMWIHKNKKYFIVIPGVPYEMTEMMESFVVPKLISIRKDLKSVKIITNLQTTGIPESHLYDRLGNIEELLKGSKLAFLPNQYGVKLRLTVEGLTEDEAHDKVTEIEQTIRGLIGRYIYGKETDTIEEVVAKILSERELKIAVAESCTGGLISHRLTNINGSSNYYERGTVTYSNAAKVELLKVSEDIIAEKGAVSIDVARQMAEGIKAVSGVDIGLAVTGIMGPTGGTAEKPVGLVFVGICDDKICTAKEFRFGNDRLLNKERTSQAALEMLRRHLLGISYDE